MMALKILMDTYFFQICTQDIIVKLQNLKIIIAKSLRNRKIIGSK